MPVGSGVSASREEAPFRIAKSKCYFEEISGSDGVVRRSLATLDGGLADVVTDVRVLKVSWFQRQDRYHFILVIVSLSGEDEHLRVLPALTQAAADLHDSIDTFETLCSYLHDSFVPLSMFDQFLRSGGFSVEKASDYSVNRIVLDDRARMEYSANSCRLFGRSGRDIAGLRDLLKQVVAQFTSYSTDCLAFAIHHDESEESEHFSISKPYSRRFDCRLANVRMSGTPGSAFWKYATLLAIMETLFTELSFVRYTGAATKDWIYRTDALFDTRVREKGFFHVDFTHEMVADLRAWLPNLSWWIGFLENDLKELSSDPLATSAEISHEIKLRDGELSKVEEMETLLNSSLPILLDRVNSRWDEMKTRLVIEKTQGEILADIRLLNRQLQDSSEAMLQVLNQQKEDVVKLLQQIEQGIEPNERSKARGWMDKVSAGLGTAADAANLLVFLTGAASLPAFASMLPQIWEFLLNACRMINASRPRFKLV